MITTEQIAIRLLLAAFIGAVIGFDREYYGKSAGFRTLILISVGSGLFTIISMLIDADSKDRIASNLVTGIGFLGAGVILRGERGVKGLTTAASIWATAALGMCAGGGFYIVAGVGAVLCFCTLSLFPKFEDMLARRHSKRRYKITLPYSNDVDKNYEDLFKKYHLRFKRTLHRKTGGNISLMWEAIGAKDAHDSFVQQVLQDDSVTDFEW